jgi:hypothetical protein
MVTAYLECRYRGYVSNSSIKTQSNGVFGVTMRTRPAKPRPADAQVEAFRPHVTILQAVCGIAPGSDTDIL